MSKKSITPGKQIGDAVKNTMQEIGASYEAALEENMSKLHNQIVAYVSAAKLPLPQVLLVLQMLVNETMAQARQKYLGE